jgi:hypothetical protein
MSNNLRRRSVPVMILHSLIVAELLGSLIGCKPHHQAPGLTDSAEINAVLEGAVTI